MTASAGHSEKARRQAHGGCCEKPQVQISSFSFPFLFSLLFFSLSLHGVCAVRPRALDATNDNPAHWALIIPPARRVSIPPHISKGLPPNHLHFADFIILLTSPFSLFGCRSIGRHSFFCPIIPEINFLRWKKSCRCAILNVYSWLFFNILRQSDISGFLRKDGTP